MGVMRMQRGVREAITTADDLSRKAYREHEQRLSQTLDSIRTTLTRIDTAIGGRRTSGPYLEELARLTRDLGGLVDKLAPELRARGDELLDGLESFHAWITRELPRGAPARVFSSRPVFGALGLAAIAAPFLLGYHQRRPRVAALSVALGVGSVLASVLTDSRFVFGGGDYLHSAA